MKPLCVVLVLAIVAAFSLDLTAPVEARDQRPDLENYDIRDDAPAIERIRGAKTQRQRANDPRFKIEFNEALDVAEVVSPSGTQFLAQGRKRSDVLRSFISANRNIFGVTEQSQLHLGADYRNPDGNLAFVRLEQQLNGIPVFGSELTGGFTRRDELFRVINTLAPDIDNVTGDFGSEEAAAATASRHIGFEKSSITEKITTERFYFPVGNGVAVPAWRVHLQTPTGGAYYVVVDPNGTLLWRKNLVEHQTVPATYNPYITVDYIQTADSPSPLTPGCTSPLICPSPPAISRGTLTLIGNEGANSFNNLGWIPDGGLEVRTPANPNITDGNNVEAGIDRMAPQGVDENGWAFGSPTRVFNYSYNPAPGIPPPGEEPLPTTQTYPASAFQQGAITHGFYLLNRWHDEMYRLGFNEQARNMQHHNFGRGGAEGDRISLQSQDSSGFNGANSLHSADGTRPYIQMFIWNGSTPDRDAVLDSQVVLHEATHLVSTRLIGNSTGLNSNMSRAMGEGWSDFYAIALLSQPSDNSLGTHAVGAYATYMLGGIMEASYYYGIRRFPFAVMRSRGPNGLPHNPLTFRYVNAGCDTLIGTTSTNPSSAFPRNPVVSTSSSVQACDQIHNMGEVWAVALWEVRDQLVQRRGPAEGNRRALQYVTDAMKLSPLNPTLLQMRDSVIAAVNVSDSTDLGPVYRGFAIRGMGDGAAIVNPGTGVNNTVVTESFLVPPAFQRRRRADFDGDGRTDVSVFRPSDRVWYLNRSSTGFTAMTWGLATDQPVPDDYDGDGKEDMTVFRATGDGSMPDFYVFRSTDSTVSYISWGTTGDVGLSNDYDGDRKADHAIYRPSTAQFWIRRSTDGGTILHGPIAGSPLGMDYDGDGRADFATFENGTWRIVGNGSGFGYSLVAGFGMAGDKPVPADYDGDGRDDIAVYRPSDGNWYIATSSGGLRIEHWGIATDIPTPGDYDGDSRADLAVYRDGVWYLNRSSSGVLVTWFGLAGDKPLPGSYYP